MGRFLLPLIIGLMFASLFIGWCVAYYFGEKQKRREAEEERAGDAGQ